MRAKTIKINESFTCINCRTEVPPAQATCRNHCHKCLWSLHLDREIPGDRACKCQGAMEAVHVERRAKGWMILHRCTKCGEQKYNRVLDDDDWGTVIELSQFA